MGEIVQKVKYQVEVSTTELDRFKTAVDSTNASIGALNTAFRSLSTSIDQGMLKAFATLNGRISRFNTVAPAAVDTLEKMAAPMGGLAASMTKLAEQFGHFATTTNRALDDLRKFNAEMGRTKEETVSEAEVQSRTLNSKGLKWLKYYGIIRSGWEATKWVFNEIKEGAQQMDLEKVLGRQFDGFEAMISKARDLTKGTVSSGSLTKSYALMSSFGIPMDQFAENMELVQKMAVRTGQSADFLSESFARGISRLSPPILDNLGIQVKLSDATTEYAEATGILTTEMTKEQKTAALLNHVLKLMKERTEGVSLSTDSAAASANRAEAALSDLLMTAKKVAGMSLSGIDMIFQSQKSDIEHYVDAMTRLTYALPDDRQVTTLNAFFSTMAKSSEGADLLSSFDFMQLSGSGRNNISNLSEMFQQSGDALSRFDRLAKGAAAGTDQLTLAFNTLGDTTWAKKFLLNDEDIAAVGVFDLMQRNLEAAAKQANDLLESLGDTVTEKDRQVILDKAAEAAQAATAKRMQDAIKYAKANNTDREETVLLMTRETSEFEKQADLWAEILEKSATSRRGSAQALKLMQEELAASAERVRLSNDLFEVTGGQRIAEVEFNRVLAERVPLEKALEDAQKALADAADDTARIEAQRSMVAANNALVEQAALRATAQAAMLADKQILDSYRSMSKEKLKETLTMVKAQISLLNFSQDPLIADRKRIEIAELQKTAEIIQSLIDKPRGGGGGRASDEYNPFKPIKNAKPTFYGWTFDDLLDAGGKLQELKDKLTTPGQIKGGFFGDSSFFGVTSEEDLKKAQDRLTEFYKFRQEAQWRFRNASQQEKDLSGLWDPIFEADETIKPRLEALARHFEILADITKNLGDVSTAMGTFKDGMSGLFGEDMISMVSGFTSGLEGFTEALNKNAGAYSLVNAAMPVVRSFTQNLIKNRKAQAAIEALMQGAAAWAAYASNNPAGGFMHTMAAGMYLAVAGGALRLPKGKGKDTNPDDSKVKSQTVKGGDRHFHWHGQIATTEAERGAMIREMIRESERAGI